MNIKYILSNRAHLLDESIKVLSYNLWTLLNYLSAKWWGISIGKNAHFRGYTKFKRLPDSVINIGESCTFNNQHTSNMAGLFCPCIISTAKRNAYISIGNNCGFSGVRIRSGLSVKIGSRVRCGANSYITDTDAHFDDPRSGKDRPVVIEDGVWLGMNVVVLKGVHIGKNTLIGANSVVTKDIPANSIAAGNPCRVIKEISDTAKEKLH